MNRYLVVNFDRKEYLRPEAFGEHASLDAVVKSNEGILLGLTALLSDSNGRGGGDLRTESDLIGSWSGCRIALVDDKVTHPTLCEPGMESTPLQQQVLALGRDVSQDIIQVLVAGEGEYCILSQLNAQHKVPLVEQRALPDPARRLLLTAKGRDVPLRTLEQPFAVLGVGMPLTPKMAARRLQEGLNKMAPYFGVTSPAKVCRVEFEYGSKTVMDNYRRQAVLQGVTRMRVELLDPAASGTDGVSVAAARVVDVTLDGKSTSTKELYEQLLGVTEFENPLALPGRSAEVAKLLSMIPNIGA